MVWVASVISYKSSMRWLLLGQFDEMSKYKSQFDPKWFELVLLSYLINLQWDDSYSNICDEMSKFEVSIYLKWFELVLLSYLINLQWDECYSNICDEMSKYEDSFWSKLVWVRASVISYKSSMRWML